MFQQIINAVSSPTGRIRARPDVEPLKMARVKVSTIERYAWGPGLQTTTGARGAHVSSKKMLLLVWLVMGVLPMSLQIRSYVKFVTPHKITSRLVEPVDGVKETLDIWEFCPVKEWFLAGVYWNLMPTHYFQREGGVLCHYVIPQYNIHGNYYVGNQTTHPFATSPADCAEESNPFQHYFYHGSIGFYSLYGEVKGTYCPKHDTAYVIVGLGTFDINGPHSQTMEELPAIANLTGTPVLGQLGLLLGAGSSDEVIRAASVLLEPSIELVKIWVSKTPWFSFRRVCGCRRTEKIIINGWDWRTYSSKV